MAGATAEVLLPHTISDAKRELIEKYIRAVASSVEWKSFWIAGQPFTWYDGPVDDDDFVLDIQGLIPRGVVGICAMCRGSVSEAYLAMLVARIAETLWCSFNRRPYQVSGRRRNFSHAGAIHRGTWRLRYP